MQQTPIQKRINIPRRRSFYGRAASTTEAADNKESQPRLETDRVCADSPNEPPALQVLLDDLHGDPFLKADLVLPLTGVRLQRHVSLLCPGSKRKERQKRDNVMEL